MSLIGDELKGHLEPVHDACPGRLLRRPRRAVRRARFLRRPAGRGAALAAPARPLPVPGAGAAVAGSTGGREAAGRTDRDPGPRVGDGRPQPDPRDTEVDRAGRPALADRLADRGYLRTYGRVARRRPPDGRHLRLTDPEPAAHLRRSAQRRGARRHRPALQRDGARADLVGCAHRPPDVG